MTQKYRRICCLIITMLIFSVFGGAATISASPFWIDLETGAAFTGYNDVRIPADVGTFFSLADDLDPKPVWFYRIQAGAELGRHGIVLLYAPLLVKSTGSIDKNVTFYGKDFTAGTPLDGTYKFNSYRLTWRYTLVDNGTIRFAAGLTGKIRDAYIELKDGTESSRRTDLGVVPLIHLDFIWNMSQRLALTLTGDGLAAPQGRAEDFLLALIYRPQDDLELRIGYRLLEGGSDGGGSVYTFSMFHYATAGVRYRL
jgi:hypothetical protein